jgi:isopenicillin N synthase-like dioxygenase
MPSANGASSQETLQGPDGPPVIDAQQLLRPGATDVPEQVAAAIAAAASSWGFFQLVNHGCDDAVLQRMNSAMHSFFDLPLETKLQVGLVQVRLQQRKWFLHER